MRNVLVILAGVAMIALAGCAGTRQACPKPEPALPGPTTININANLSLELPKELARELNAQGKVDGSLVLKVNAEAISASPVRSRYVAQIEMVMRHPDGTPVYIDFKTTMGGEYDGTPNDGVGAAFRGIMSTARLFGEAIPPRPADSGEEGG